MKKMNFKKAVSSNKGNATYYVLAVIMIITIMVSGLLTVSLRSSIVSMNYANDIESYNKCDSALQKIKGQLKVALVGETVIDSSSLLDTGNSNNIILLATGGKNEVINGVTIKNYYPVDMNKDNYKLCIYDILGDSDEEELSVVVRGEAISNGENQEGFWVEEYSNGVNDIVIKSVHVECGNVGIITDIKIAIATDSTVTDVVFENYRIITVTETGGDG